MKYVRTFGFKTICGFGILVLVMLVDTILSNKLLSRLHVTEQESKHILLPSRNNLEEFPSLIFQTGDGLQYWEQSGGDADDPGLFNVRTTLMARLPQIHQQSRNLILVSGILMTPAAILVAIFLYTSIFGLVGRCVQEGNTLFLNYIPEDYIKIKSGLGEDNPRCLLILPLRLHEEIMGVIEIATPEEFQDFQIEFVERIGTSIASSMSAAFADRWKSSTR
jgi:hypothetical protein